MVVVADELGARVDPDAVDARAVSAAREIAAGGDVGGAAAGRCALGVGVVEPGARVLMARDGGIEVWIEIVDDVLHALRRHVHLELLAARDRGVDGRVTRRVAGQGGRQARAIVDEHVVAAAVHDDDLDVRGHGDRRVRLGHGVELVGDIEDCRFVVQGRAGEVVVPVHRVVRVLHDRRTDVADIHVRVADHDDLVVRDLTLHAGSCGVGRGAGATLRRAGARAAPGAAARTTPELPEPPPELLLPEPPLDSPELLPEPPPELPPEGERRSTTLRPIRRCSLRRGPRIPTTRSHMRPSQGEWPRANRRRSRRADASNNLPARTRAFRVPDSSAVVVDSCWAAIKSPGRCFLSLPARRDAPMSRAPCVPPGARSTSRCRIQSLGKYPPGGARCYVFRHAFDRDVHARPRPRCARV